MKSRGIAAFDKVLTRYIGRRRTIGRMDVDVVESGTSFKPLPGLRIPVAQRGRIGSAPPVLNTQKWFQTLRSGISIANPANSYPNWLSVGALGFFLQGANGTRYLVSNNHVIGRLNEANTGEPIVQPGTLDLNQFQILSMPTIQELRNSAEIARIAAIVPMSLIAPNTPYTSNEVDAGIAKLTNSDRLMGELDRLSFGGTIRKVAASYRVDAHGSIQGSARVYKVGRTTGYTEGRIVGLAGASTIDYEGGQAYFVNQIVVEASNDNGGPFSANGDSGSGVLNDRHELVGLLFGGSEQQTLVNPIGSVLEALRSVTGDASLKVITA